MKTPEWLKPGIYGAVVGAVFTMVAGFSWGGWVTGGGAEEMASDMANDTVIAALLPVCVDMAQNDIDRVAKLATIREASTYKRRDALMATGWATVPGSDAPNRDLAQACIAGLQLDES